jgi:hypothetical protein
LRRSTKTSFVKYIFLLIKLLIMGPCNLCPYPGRSWTRFGIPIGFLAGPTTRCLLRNSARGRGLVCPAAGKNNVIGKKKRPEGRISPQKRQIGRKTSKAKLHEKPILGGGYSKPVPPKTTGRAFNMGFMLGTACRTKP